MSLFCLVHGSTQNASCWDLLIPELEQRGHEVVRMNLPAGEPEASATRYADAIAEAIPAERDDVIVVAHSASGLFLPFVPERRRVRRLVFLAAVIPQIGKSLLDQVNEDKSMFNPEWLGKDPTKDEQIARRFLFHDCSPETTNWAFGHNATHVCAPGYCGDLSFESLAGCSVLLHFVRRGPGDPAAMVPPRCARTARGGSD